MILTNQRTGVAFITRTTHEKMRGHFVSIVTRREGNNEWVASREHHPTRAKAYRYAVTMARSLARSHREIYGM